MDITDIIVTGYSTLTIIGQAVVLALLVMLSVVRRDRFTEWVTAHGLSLMLAVAFLATLGSLYFSDVAGWTPCKLCWYQRIFMYPQVPMLALALWKNDRTVARYILLLSVIGFAFAIFHYSEQVTAALFPKIIDPSVPCDTTGTSCASTPFFHFGYITIPMMAATAFALNIVGALYVIRKVK